MQIHCLQHANFEGPGFIKIWAESKGHQLTTTHLYKGGKLPNPEHIDLLVIMGGPMGVSDEVGFPWLKKEKEYVAQAIQSGKKIIGICLGAQLLAHVLGADVRRSEYSEIGWFPVLQRENHPLLVGIPPQFYAFHWHSDMFDIPSEAVPVFKSAGCPNQGFIYKNQVAGFQFHFETTPESITAMLDNENIDSYEEQFIQSSSDIYKHSHYCLQLNSYLEKILDRLIR